MGSCACILAKPGVKWESGSYMFQPRQNYTRTALFVYQQVSQSQKRHSTVPLCSTRQRKMTDASDMIAAHREYGECAARASTRNPLPCCHNYSQRRCPADFLFKVVLVGPSNVGKTALVQRYVKGIFDQRFDTTSTLEDDRGGSDSDPPCFRPGLPYCSRLSAAHAACSWS